MSEIASGGMGRVYLARARGPLGFEKLVALKTVHPELASEKAFVEMFFDEAAIAARIDHPNVCRVFDFGEADGQYFIAMEYLAGQNAAKVLRKVAALATPEPLYEAFVAKIIADAAEGLHAAHELKDERGESLEVVHRDVSPQNLFITYDGAVRVLDFGVASAQGRLHQTTTGSVKGKFGYMAPEQMRREKADRRADIWSLGVVSWELLTLQRLHKTTNELDVVLAVLNDPIRRPSEVRPVDPALEAIVLRALAKDPSARYATARELAQDLYRFILGRNEVIGLAEMSAFMRRLFPDERATAVAAAERAVLRDPEPPPSPASPVAHRSAPAPAVEVFATTSAPRVERERSALWVGSGLLALGALAAGGWWATQHGFGSAGLTTENEPITAVDGVPDDRPDAARSGPDAGTDGGPPDAPADAAGGGASSIVAGEESSEPEVLGHDGRHSKRRGGAAGASPLGPDRDEAEPGGSGVLVVETPGGWADVYVDGERVGRTPLRVELPTGSARLELRPFGLASGATDATMRRRISLGARPTRVVVDLAP